MMPYIVGKDPDTDEIIVGDARSNSFFLRGSKDSIVDILNLVSDANNYRHRIATNDGITLTTPG